MYHPSADLFRPDEEVLEGVVQRLAYEAPDHSFRVFVVQPPTGTPVQVAQSAPLAPLASGDGVQVRGRYTNSQRWGRQLRASDVLRTLPTSGKGIAAILAGPRFPGIGAKAAEKIVAGLGNDTIACLDGGDVDGRLANIVGQKNAADIIRRWQTDRAETHLSMTLASLDIGPALRKRIFAAYDDVADILQHNPYRLISDIDGVGFLRADAIARASGIPRDNRMRLRAGLQHALEVAQADGHSGLPPGQLIEAAAEMLTEPSRDTIRGVLEEAIAAGEVEIAPNGLVQRRRVAAVEQRLANRLRAHARLHPLLAPTPELLAVLDRAAQHYQLTDTQRSAVLTALTTPLSVLTGGPGTGKTRTLQALVAVAVRFMPRRREAVKLMAPAGKAADRMAQATGHPASTIHRGMRWTPDEGGFLHNRDNPLEADLIAIDETSMADLFLADAIMQAAGAAHVVFVGDVDQLPSVDCGRFLDELIRSEIAPVTRLDQIFRQAAGSGIAASAAAVRQGRAPAFDTPDVRLIIDADADHIGATLPGLVADIIPRHYGIAPADIQVLTPRHDTATGTTALNIALQERLNPSLPLTIPGGQPARIQKNAPVRAGDRVIFTANNYEFELYNGDSGTVAGMFVREKAPFLGIHFRNRLLHLPLDQWQNVALAYALTIHKAQGSEYPCVVMPITTSHYRMLTRPLFYTGLSRAKQLCVIVGTRRAIQIAVSTTETQSRHSGLVSRIAASL